MVLDDGTTTPSDFTSDYTPDSDADPYSTITSPDEFIAMRLPSPPPILGPLFGYTNAYCTRVINTRIRASAQILGRSTTQDEATALAYWSAKMLSYAAWGRPLGMAAGLYQCYRTAATYRFPFMQPKPDKFNPNLFSFLKFQLQGRQAQIMWHALRASLYGAFGMWTGGLLVGTYAATVAAVGERQDPRLQDLIRVIQVKVRETLPASSPGGPGKQRQGQRGDSTGQGARSGARTTGTYEDDASPSSGDAYDPYGSSTPAEQGGSLAMSERNVLTDRQMRKREARQRPNPRSSPTETTASTFRIDKIEGQPRSFDDDDNASPTGGEGSFMDSGYDSDAGASTTGSAWDRIRQQSSSSSSARRVARGNRRGVQTQEDSFAFSATEQERHLAKDEAQRAFDERVEKERRGGEF